MFALDKFDEKNEIIWDYGNTSVYQSHLRADRLRFCVNRAAQN